mmetsp:Transcript_15064/g.45601  ORF Transcript_15064/g.45601 Transcript_15064/m.45601 type:complete len:105 (-) Transcript_15064:117-431(-)
MANLIPMYVRVKRKSQTIFLTVEKSDTALSVKQKLGEIVDVGASSIKLFTAKDDAGSEFQDTAYVDTFVDNDAVLYMVLKKDGSDAWEEVDVDDVPAPKQAPPS